MWMPYLETKRAQWHGFGYGCSVKGGLRELLISSSGQVPGIEKGNSDGNIPSVSASRHA